MRYVITLALRSLFNRKLTTALTAMSIALSVALLIGVERVRQGARASFAGTISQTDLIVGQKGGTIQLLLYSVFRMGSATGNISYGTYQQFKDHPLIAWTIPISLGDSYQGFRVVGTDESFYERYRFRGDRTVAFAEGKAPQDLFDVVLGHDVATRLSHRIGDRIVIGHGVSTGPSVLSHDDMPFRVIGILAKTATPIDRSVYISLQGMEAIHHDWKEGVPPPLGQETAHDVLRNAPLEVGQITAFLVGAKSRIDTLRLQREVNSFTGEPLMAIIPGVALSELWNGISYAEDGLRVISMFVVLVGLLGMLVSLYTSLNERRREMAILRAVGAGPRMIASLLVMESALLSIAGAFFGTVLVYALLFAGQPWIEYHFGLFLPIGLLSGTEWGFIALIIVLGFFIGLLPAMRAYRNTLSDGLTVRT